MSMTISLPTEIKWGQQDRRRWHNLPMS